MSRRKGRTARNRYRKNVNKSESEAFTKDDYQELLQWMRKEFGFTSKLLKVANFSKTGRGMMARKAIYSGQEIISVPRSGLIGVKQAFRDSILLQSFESHHKIRKNFKIIGTQALCVFLIEEKRKASLSLPTNVGKWKQYVQVLPCDFSHVLYWGSAALNLLPQSLQDVCKNFRKRIKKDWTLVNRLLLEGKNAIGHLCGSKLLSKLLCEEITYDQYKWAWCCVNTRCVYSDHDEIAFDCLLNDESKKYFLVPFLDLLNHSNNANVKASFKKSNQCFEIRSFSDYKKFEQVFIHYGNHSSTKLMMEYGFIVLDEINKNDVVGLSWEQIVRFYNFGDQKLTTIKEFLSKRFLCSDWSFCYDGPSWSLAITMLLLELIKGRTLDLRNIIHFSQISLSSNQAKELQYEVQKRLSSLAKEKLLFINGQVEKCVRKMSSVDGKEKQHVEMVTAYWKISSKVITSSVNFCQCIDVCDYGVISINENTAC